MPEAQFYFDLGPALSFHALEWCRGVRPQADRGAVISLWCSSFSHWISGMKSLPFALESLWPQFPAAMGLSGPCVQIKHLPPSIFSSPNTLSIISPNILQTPELLRLTAPPAGTRTHSRGPHAVGIVGQMRSHCSSGTSPRPHLNIVGLPQPASLGIMERWSLRAHMGTLVMAGEQGVGTRQSSLQPSCHPLQATERSTLLACALR